MFDLDDGAGDLDNEPSADLSVEECLLDLVNHIPPRVAQRVGSLFQHFEAVKRGHKLADTEEPGIDEDCASIGSSQPMIGESRDLENKRHVEEQEQAFHTRQEQLEQQFRDQTAELASETNILRDELSESRQRSSIMQQSTPTEAKLRELEAIQSQTFAGELESMSNALASTDSKLIDVGVRLGVTTQQTDRFRDKAVNAELELKTLRLRAEEATAGLQLSEELRGRLSAEARDMEETQRRLRTELARETHKRKQAQERLGMELKDARERSEATASAKTQLELFCHEVKEVGERLCSSEQIEDQLREELAEGRLAQETLEAKTASVRVRSVETHENLQKQVSRAEASAQQSSLELEHAEAEILVLQKPAAEVADLRAELAAEQTLVRELRQQAQAEQASLRSETEMASAQMEHLRRQMEVADAARNSKYVSILASKLVAATTERDDFCRGLQHEHERVLEQHTRSTVLTRENAELRWSQEALRAELNTQAEQEAAIATEIAEASMQVEQRQASELEERYMSILSELEDLRKQRSHLVQAEAEHSSTAAAVANVTHRIREVDAALRQGRLQEMHCSARWESSCLERACLEEDLSFARARMAEERELRSQAESTAASLAADKETLCRRLKTIAAEADRGCKHETCLARELVSLNKALRMEAQELKDEMEQRDHYKVEARILQASRSELQSCLKLEKVVSSTAVKAVKPDSKWSFPTVPLSLPLSGSSKGAIELLRDELNDKREQLEDHSKRAKHFEQLCSAVNAEETEMHSSVDPRVPALSQELREVEEEGKVRREQLEAETSLMAMEVLTLTKGLGGRLLDGGILNLTRPPLSVHDIRFRLGAVSRNHAMAYGFGQTGIPPGGRGSETSLGTARAPV